jgi:hypothetical protein
MLSERNEANGGTKETLFSHSEDQTCDSSATHLQHLRQRLSHALTGWRPAKALTSSSDIMGCGVCTKAGAIRWRGSHSIEILLRRLNLRLLESAPCKRLAQHQYLHHHLSIVQSIISSSIKTSS